MTRTSMSSAVARICNANRTNQRKQNDMSNYHKLYTPQDGAVVFIDQQPQMTFAVANTDRATLINNVTLLAKSRRNSTCPPCSPPSKPNRSAVTSGRSCSTCFP